MLRSQKGGELIVTFTERFIVTSHREMELIVIHREMEKQLLRLTWRVNSTFHREMES